MNDTPPKKIGRPSARTEAIVERIIEGLTSGVPLATMCAEPDMPGASSVYRWMEEDKALSDAIARARLYGFDRIAADALAISDTPELGEETITKPDGAMEVRSGDMLGHRKLRVETRLKLLAKWDPKRYGEATLLKHADAEGGKLPDEPRQIMIVPVVAVTPAVADMRDVTPKDD